MNELCRQVKIVGGGGGGGGGGVAFVFRVARLTS